MHLGKLLFVIKSGMETVYPEYLMKPNKYYTDPINRNVFWWTRVFKGKLQYHLDQKGEKWTDLGSKASMAFVMERNYAHNRYPSD